MKNQSPKFIFFFLFTLMPYIAMAGDQKEKIPNLEFLEFLSEWSTQQNEWVDPSLMEKIEKEDGNASTDSENTESARKETGDPHE